MNKKTPRQNGFSLIETLLLIFVVGIIGFVMWYLFDSNQTANRSYNSVNGGQTTPKTPVKVNGLVVYESSYTNNLWQTYKSSHSSAQFQYPADWKLTQKAIKSSDNTLLESISVKSPNGKEVDFSLYKTYHGQIIQNYMCTVPLKPTVLAELKDGLKISYDSYNNSPTHLFVRSQDDLIKGYGHNPYPCQAYGPHYIAMPNDQYVVFEYYDPTPTNGSHPSPTDFFANPEINMIVNILESFKA